MSGFSTLDGYGGVKLGKSITSITITTTGTINDLDFSNADVVFINNATAATITGLKAGVAGQEVTLVRTNTALVSLVNESASSSAVNRLKNTISSIDIPLGGGGRGAATYRYDPVAARWHMVAYQQGAAVSYTPAWTSTGTLPTLGNATLTGAYSLVGSRLFFDITFVFGSTSVGGTGSWLFSIPGTLTTTNFAAPALATQAGTGSFVGACASAGAGVLNVVDAIAKAVYTAAIPFTWGTGDTLYITGSIAIS